MKVRFGNHASLFNNHYRISIHVSSNYLVYTLFIVFHLVKTHLSILFVFPSLKAVTGSDNERHRQDLGTPITSTLLMQRGEEVQREKISDQEVKKRSILAS